MQQLITILFLFIACNAEGQYYWQESFEAPNDFYRDRFVIDSTNPGNKWQIGRPQKAVFDSAYSPDNAIVTDTINTYPGHDTSVFTVVHQYQGFTPMFILSFYYKLDQGGNCITKVEISGDNGQNWINPMTEDSTYMFYWNGPKPRLDTQVVNWTKFVLNMEDWAHGYPGGPIPFPHYRTSDTVLFRFTFASGGVSVPYDGWIIDNFSIENTITEGYVPQVRRDEMIDMYPNPSGSEVTVKSKQAQQADIEVYDLKGRCVYREHCNTGNAQFDPRLPDGVYLLRYITNSSYAVKSLIVKH